VFTAATTAILVVMMVVMPVIVGMIMGRVTAVRVVMAATIVSAGLLATTLPTREQHEEKSGGEHEYENDERVHSVA
jgi:hypothetical protein